MIFFILIWSLCTLGLLSLTSSMSKHQKQIYAKTLTQKQTRLATVLGWILLCIALGICIANGQKSNMISYWIGVITFSALFVGLCLSYFETKIKQISLVVLSILLISTITQFILK